LVKKNTQVDMPQLMNHGRRVGLRVGLFPIHEYWHDVGRPADLVAANEHHQYANEVKAP
jgi:NDP-sugar pyrophosphorylase family protein